MLDSNGYALEKTINRTCIFQAQQCNIPKNAVITNYGICELCGGQYLRELNGTDEGFCGRLGCYLARLFRSTSVISKTTYGHTIKQRLHRGWGSSTTDDGIKNWAEEKLADQRHREVLEVHFEEISKYYKTAKHHRALMHEAIPTPKLVDDSEWWKEQGKLEQDKARRERQRRDSMATSPVTQIEDKVKTIENLMPRDILILKRLSEGFGHKEIATQFGVAVGTVKNRMHLIHKFLKTRTSAQAVVVAMNRGLLK